MGKQTNIGGYLTMLLAFTLLGTVLSWLYLGINDFAIYIYGGPLVALGFGFLLALLVKVLRNNFKATSPVASAILVIIGLLIINILRWQMFFGIWYWRIDTDGMYYFFDPALLRPLWHFPEFVESFTWIMGFHLDPTNETTFFGEFLSDLRYFNGVGTWSIGHWPVVGVPLGFIWIVEMLFICILPLRAVRKHLGVAIKGKDNLADPVNISYNFERFSKEEIRCIAIYGEIDIIANKPIVPKREDGKISKVAECYLDGHPTDYIAIYNTTAKKDNGNKGRGRLKAIVKLDFDKINELKERLKDKHEVYRADV